MDKITRHELAAKHRELLRRGNPKDALRSRSRDFEFAFEVGDGWLPIVDGLLTSLTQVVAAMPPDERELFSVLQIKEKFAELRVYCSLRSGAIATATAAAADRARRTCEECGDFGLMRSFGTFLAVRC